MYNEGISKEPDVTVARLDLESKIDLLCKKIEILKDRVSPVLCGEGKIPVKVGDKEDAPKPIDMRSPMAISLTGLAIRLGILSVSIDEILERLEI